ncbi:MAG: acyl-CoA dehydrogenase family protein [Kibdelosporangium sp.]
MLSRETPSWQALCDQIGVAGLAVPEEYGGAGASLAEVAVVLEELGRTLAAVPMLSSALTSQALLLGGDAAACGRLLPLIASGAVASVLWAESPTATVPYVLDGDIAEILLIATPSGLFEADPATTRRVHTPTMDSSRRLATVELSGGTPLGSAVPQLRDIARILLSTEQVGTAQRCLDMTVEYTKARVQFGRPIGSFQALKHRMADMYVLVETARSIAYAAVSAPSPTLAAAASAHCTAALSTVAGEMIQLHGGIAITWEHDAHRYFKRAHGSAQLFAAGAPTASRRAEAR